MKTKRKYSLPIQKHKKKNKTKKNKKHIKITCDFESGNCKILKISTKNNKDYYVKLTKNHEPYPKHIKRKYENWFYFKVNNCKDKNITFDFKYLKYFQNNFNKYTTCYSYDNKIWKRTPTTIKKDNIVWSFTPKKNTIWFAYYAPYTTKRKNKLMLEMKKKSNTKYKVLGLSNMKQKIDMLKIGHGDKHMFIVARQHPGETVGSYMAEGLLKEFFESKHSKKRKEFVKKYTLNIIPMCNPDGVYLGHWYTNKKGCNLNRNWQKRRCVENQIILDNFGYQNYGVLYIDLHGDEGADNHFVTHGSPKPNVVYDIFNKTINSIDENFQLKDYYEEEEDRGNHNTFGIWGTYDCKWKNAMTIEACMKHPLYKHMKSIEEEPIKVGRNICKTIFKVAHLL